MTLARDLADFVYSVRLDSVPPDVQQHAKTLLLDAIACMLAGQKTAVTSVALAAGRVDECIYDSRGMATIFANGSRASATTAAFINGTMLRSLDLIDTYVSADVCHPGEAIPPALACAEAVGACGRLFLECVIAAVVLHMQMADFMPLHRQGLHHAGHASWVVPLVTARLIGADISGAVHSLAAVANQLMVPERFARDQLSNFKAFAYPLIARHAIEAAFLARHGMTCFEGACEHILTLLGAATGIIVKPEALVPTGVPDNIFNITLKAYPAQYALQPLVAAASRHRATRAHSPDDIDRVIIRVNRKTKDRTADPAKYRPSTPEAADHSLPFCVAIALIEGDLSPAALITGRWRDRDVRTLMARIEVEVSDDTMGFSIGEQRLCLILKNGAEVDLDCSYPFSDQSWRSIAETKLVRFGAEKVDVPAIMAVVDNIDDEPDLSRLVTLISGTPPIDQAAAIK